jgi:hypothetical protein
MNLKNKPVYKDFVEKTNKKDFDSLKNKPDDFDEETFFNNVDFFIKEFAKIYRKYCEKASLDLEFAFAVFVFYYMLKNRFEDKFKGYGFSDEEIKEFEEDAKKVGEDFYKRFKEIEGR